MIQRLLTGCFLCIVVNGWSEDAIYFAHGWGMDDSLIQSGSIGSAKMTGLGWQHDLSAEFNEPWMYYGRWYVNFEYYRASGEHAAQDYDMDIYTIKPTLRLFPGGSGADQKVYFEAALGAAYLTETKFEEVRMSSKLNFALHFTVGLVLDEPKHWALALGYNHYSNGYLDQPNPGIDFATLMVQYQFQ